MIFGENLLALLVLAIGAALAFGNLMALLRPRSAEDVGEGEVARPPLLRSIGMILLGLLAAVWALVSLANAEPSDPLAPSSATEISTQATAD